MNIYLFTFIYIYIKKFTKLKIRRSFLIYLCIKHKLFLLKMYYSRPITSTEDCGGIHICSESGRNFLVPLGTKTEELLNTLIKMFNGQLNRPYYVKSAQPKNPIFGVLRLNDPHFLQMKKSHRDLFEMIVDHYTGLQLIFDTDKSTNEHPVHIYGHNADHVWRIHCNDIVTEIYVDAESIVQETIESFRFAYRRDE
jgi:hypothetical protein